MSISNSSTEKWIFSTEETNELSLIFTDASGFGGFWWIKKIPDADFLSIL